MTRGIQYQLSCTKPLQRVTGVCSTIQSISDDNEVQSHRQRAILRESKHVSMNSDQRLTHN